MIAGDGVSLREQHRDVAGKCLGLSGDVRVVRSPFRFKGVHSQERLGVLHVSSRNLVSIKALNRREIGKVWADVKSESYDIADSAPESVRFEDALGDIVLGKDDLDSGVLY
ncbi:hypothetical protein F0562_005848 [Nyssa sinensis]|uniref:Uncharacterized protein n=1 Tax=Nyssa sinensis TaxID=561372 RepID=A0A5J5ALS6_9ASTE|nr:hypothetical protein F0562_005848 [Nyssa sinensis]